MRKVIILAAIALTSVTANAGQSKGPSLASSETAPAAATEQSNTEQPLDGPTSVVERPKLATPKEPAKVPVLADRPPEATTPKKKHLSTEARVIYELHRHGIYW
jgi:hypothetical protein